ncbi:ABC transporter permease [Sulfobacillus thermosulfidooxidans]|uniref:ABC transporter permease n=1 Tax=Sulfobacillus thermosulfidooxidans TaxID=28034 RepID=UPI00096BAB1D|nr:ABC transporter permease [Sulfobacillus thermosulfidooxidans]OLZ09077.1 ATPase [Sulfobacillus thermosulfidooxidans]OLZ15169.1 ATPase [Sulfobacillus thermosulfidooxidans]OLZ22158.1 ATPase [Sulfobacillus thermosulfidooxidans]
MIASKDDEVRTVSNQLGSWRTKLGSSWMVGVLALLVAVFSIVAPGFLSQQNFRSTTMYASDTLLLAVSETFVILTGGIDLSVGAVLGLSGMVSSDLMQTMLMHGTNQGISMALGILAGLVVGFVVGLVNGLVITKLRVTSFIATLGTMGIATGLTFIITNGADVTNIPSAMNAIGSTYILGWFPVPFLVAVVLAVGASLVLTHTRFGVRTYAVGSNQEGTRVSGVNINKHILKIYVISGVIAGLAGILVVARLMTGSPLEGANDELNAIAAVVIGGASLFGGRGKILGSFIGGLVIAVLVTGLVIAGVQPYWQQVAIGMVIILAVFIDQQQHRGRIY